MNLLSVNACQSTLESLLFDEFHEEVQSSFNEFVHSVPLIQNLISPNRRYAKDMPRDNTGKIIVDFENPHILEDMDYFRPSAIHYQKYGCYTKLKPNSNPNSEYGRWIREEVRRCYEGYVRPSDGEWITGDYYFFLNYCPMTLNKQSEKDPNITIRVVGFPHVWDGHYLKTHYLHRARYTGKHYLELASRGKGKSALGAALLAKRFVLGESSEVNRKVACVATASEKKYLTGADQLFIKFQSYIDFTANATQFPSRRIASSLNNMQWTMGYIDVSTGTRRGTENTVSGITSKDDESKLRGTRGVLYIIEEAGTFPRLLKLFNVLRPSVEDGNKSFGIIVAYGCCCAGTVLHLPNGKPVSIEEVKKGSTVLGHSGNNPSNEEVTWLQPTGKKECVRITTSKNNSIECSIDHPLLARVTKTSNTCTFKRASELKVGDTLLMPRRYGEFGTIHEKDAFLLGSLLGDGSYSGNQCVTLSVSSKEEYDFFTSRYASGSSHNYQSDTLFYAQLYFRSMHPLLEKYRMDKQCRESKQLPYNIYDWDKESTANFLAGYFNADGNVQIVKSKHRSIKLTSKYIHLLNDVKYLLLKFGIASHIYKEKKKATVLKSKVNGKVSTIKEGYCYVLYINNSADIVKFRDNIKLLSKRKQDRLDSYIPIQNTRLLKNMVFEKSSNGKGDKLEGKVFEELQGVTIKKIEYIGVQTIYNLTASTTNTYISNGFLSANTAGDSESDFSSMQEMMYNPLGYNILHVNNVYDKINSGKQRFSFFFPAYLNMNDCYDNDGNSDVVKALLYICSNRYQVKYNSTDPNTLLRRIAEYPIVPQEAILNVGNTIFPVNDLTARLQEIDSNPAFFDPVYTGRLEIDSNGDITFKPTTELPIRFFPHKDNKLEGSIEIFQMPEKGSNCKVFPGRYIASVDPYDNDQADTLSLGSLFVLDMWTDTIVCEYTGRPLFADDFYEVCRKVALFYDARINYENNKKGLFAYFQRMNCLYLLTDTLSFLRDKQLIKVATFGNSAKGTVASAPINKYGRDLVRDWLLKPIQKTIIEDGKEKEVTVSNIANINNRALLQELISYNDYGNFDRISSLGMLMLLREDKIIHTGGSVRRDEEVDRDYLGQDSFFTRNYKK